MFVVLLQRYCSCYVTSSETHPAAQESEVLARVGIRYRTLTHKAVSQTNKGQWGAKGRLHISVSPQARKVMIWTIDTTYEELFNAR
jgi:hypothetical protein